MSTSYYAVKVGIIPGIYNTWNEASLQVTGVPGAQHKKFNNLIDAANYIANINIIKTPPSINSIRSGESVMYTDGSCVNQVGGWAYLQLDRTDSSKISSQFCVKL